MPGRRSGSLARPEVSNGRPSVRDRAPAVHRLENPLHENAAHVVLDPPGFLVRLDQVVRFAVVQNRSLASRSLKQGGNIPAGLFRFRPVAPFRPFEDPGLEPLDSALVGQTRLFRPGQNRFRLSFVRPAAAKGKNDPFGQGMVRAPGGTCRIDRKRPSFRIDSSPAGTIPRARMGMEAETRQRCRQQGRRHRQSCSPGHGCKPHISSSTGYRISPGWTHDTTDFLVRGRTGPGNRLVVDRERFQFVRTEWSPGGR